MAHRRHWSLFSAAFFSGNKHDWDIFEALQLLIFMELEHLGFASDAIERWAAYWNCPSSGLIQKKIDQFVPHHHNDMLQVPLSVEAYKERFELLSFIFNLEDLAFDDVDHKVSPADWLSKGFFLAFHTYAADLDIAERHAVSKAAGKAGTMRSGKTYSRARITIDYAISLGNDTGAKVRSYFETEPVIDDIETEVFRDEDIYGNLIGFRFHNAATGHMSKLLRISSLSSSVSQVKKFRHKKLR